MDVTNGVIFQHVLEEEGGWETCWKLVLLQWIEERGTAFCYWAWQSHKGMDAVENGILHHLNTALLTFSSLLRIM